MQCRCGNTINNVPEHLRDLVEWVCQKCTNTAPKAQTMSFDSSEIQIKKPAQRGRPRKAA